MKQTRTFAAWLRPVAGLFALVAVLALSACGGGSGAPNNPYAPVPVIAELTVFPASPTIYSQVATTLTISGGVAPYRAFSSNSAVLPVTQNLPADTLTLLAGTVNALTGVTITIQDSAGTAVPVDVTVLPGPASPPPPLEVLPSTIDVYSTVAAQLTISGGVPPYRAFSTNSSVLPVAQNVTGNSLMLLAAPVSQATFVTVTVKDSVDQTATASVTVRPKGAAGPSLSVLPSSVTVSKDVGATLTISGGAPPYAAYSSNPAVLPVNQTVTGNSVPLSTPGVFDTTFVTVTIQDSGGQTATASVTVSPTATAPLAVLPTSAVVFSGMPSSLAVTGGSPPYRAFSSNAAVLPVTQTVAGGAIALYAASVSADTPVTVTVQDAGGNTVSSSITVRAATLLNNLTIKPNDTTCGTNAICSGQTGTASISLQVPGGGPAAGRQVRFDVVAGPYGILSTGAPPTAATVPSTIVVSDAAGVAQVIIRANVDAPTQPAQIRVTDLASGQQITGDFLIQQNTDGTSTLTVVPDEVNITGPFVGVCSSGFRVDYFIYGGTPPYRITQTFPTGAILLTPTVNASGGFFEVETNGTCVNPEQFSIVDATGRQVTATLNNVEGETPIPEPTPPSELQVVPGDLTAQCYVNNPPGGTYNANSNYFTFDFVITGGTPPYNITASPREIDTTTSPPNVIISPTVSGIAPNVGIVLNSGGSVRVSFVRRKTVLTFTDAGSPPQSLQRTLTCE